MVTVSATDGSRTSTGEKRRSSAGSFWMCWRYSSWVVAPMQGNSPRASAAFSSLAASCGPSPVEPAPMMVWISSMKTMTLPPARRTSSFSPSSFSEKEPRSCVPASTLAMSISTRVRSAPLAAAVQQPLGDALDDGGLADAGLADQQRVVGAPLAEDVDGLLDLALAADQRIELPGGGQLGEVSPELREPGELARIEGVARARRPGRSSRRERGRA